MIHTPDVSGSLSVRGATRALLVLASVATMAGCSNASPAQEAGPSEFVGNFATDNGMLYPPELWGALDTSVSASVYRNEALAATGQDVSWVMTPDELFEALAIELTPAEAAFAIDEAGLVADGDTPWSPAEIAVWWDEARNVASVDLMWKVSRLGRNAGLDLTSDDATVAVLESALTGEDLVPARQARDLLAHFAPERLALDAAAGGTAANLRHPRDASEVLLVGATVERTPPSEVDPLALELALGAVATDDLVYADLVRAYAAADEPDEAAKIAAMFDQRRVMSDGTILEPPVFAGTMGSTFRMVHYLDEAGLVDTELTEAERNDLRDLSMSVIDIDTSHRLAGLATVVLLDPASVPTQQRSDAIDAALAEEITGAGLLEIDDALAWLSIAEFAQVMEVPLEFPGLSDASIDVLRTEDPAGVAYVISRLLVVLESNAAAASDDVATLVEILESSFTTTAPADIDSLTLFGGALAVRIAADRWLFPPEMLRGEISTRTGDCRGGFGGFVRELPESQSVCNVESTRFASQLAGLIEEDLST